MQKYIIPVENVIRHYDVTGKICPRSFVEDEKLWLAFKDRLEDEEVKRYNTIDEVPQWRKVVIKLMINKGAFADVKNLNLSEAMVRMFVFNNRMGIYNQGDLGHPFFVHILNVVQLLIPYLIVKLRNVKYNKMYIY